MTALAQPWIAGLPIRAQVLLLTAAVGDRADPVPAESAAHRDGAARALLDFLAACVLEAPDHDPRAAPTAPAGWSPADLDALPHATYARILQGAEIVAYCHPEPAVASEADRVYLRLVGALHLMPESRRQMAERLGLPLPTPRAAQVPASRDEQRKTCSQSSPRL